MVKLEFSENVNIAKVVRLLKLIMLMLLSSTALGTGVTDSSLNKCWYS